MKIYHLNLVYAGMLIIMMIDTFVAGYVFWGMFILLSFLVNILNYLVEINKIK